MFLFVRFEKFVVFDLCGRSNQLFPVRVVFVDSSEVEDSDSLVNIVTLRFELRVEEIVFQ